MPFWLTLGIGFGGAGVGGGIAAGAFGSKHIVDTRGHVFVTILLEIAVATLLVVAYRRLVQRRAFTGPSARHFPTRGVGIARIRARLQQLGIDPEKLQGQQGMKLHLPTHTPPEAPKHRDEFEELRDLHEKGIITDEEFEAARKRMFS